jgi:hypothetical protein
MSGEIQANSFAPGYHANFYVHERKYNSVKVRYEVFPTYDTSNKKDRKTVTVTYVYDKKSIIQFNSPDVKSALNIFQEGSRVKFNYAFNSNACQLEIYNLIGQKITSHLLTSGFGTFLLPEKLTKGVYICIIKNEKQTLALQKFIVNH